MSEPVLEVIEVLEILVGAYPEYRPNNFGAVINIYAEALADIPINDLRAAAKECVKKCKWFPKVSELREAAEAVVHSGDNPEPDHHQWFEALKEEFFFRGQYQAREWDRLIQSCLMYRKENTAAAIEEYRNNLAGIYARESVAAEAI